MPKRLKMVFLLASATLVAQPRDTRAYLPIGPDLLYVAPDHRVWIANASGELYHYNEALQGWQASRLGEAGREGEWDMASLSGLVFFNGNEGIAAGHIDAPSGKGQSGYYRTIDGGRSWKRLDFGKDNSIHNIFTDATGRAWMVGSGQMILHSTDKGRTWKRRRSPVGEAGLVSICMRDGRNGMVGGSNNDLFTTADNWVTAAAVPTPFDQKLHHPFPENGIGKIRFWNGHYVLRQGTSVFFSEAGPTLYWQPFSEELSDFEVDAETGRLIALGQKGRVLAFSEPGRYDIIGVFPFGNPWQVAADGNLFYVVTSDAKVWRFDGARWTELEPFSSDQPISEPHLTVLTEEGLWGAEYNHLYRYDEQMGIWYRENTFPFYVRALANKGRQVLLWDGETQNYRYDPDKREAELYVPDRPLEHFLSAPLRSFTIESASWGCFHSLSESVTYHRISQEAFRTDEVEVRRKDGVNRPFRKTIKSEEVQRLLDDVNLHPDQIPAFRDFGITSHDMAAYRAQLPEHDFWNEAARTFFERFGDSIPSLDDTEMRQLLRQSEQVVSTTRSWMGVSFVNERGDTLRIGKAFHENPGPLGLHWHVSGQGIPFASASLPLARLMASAVPDDFFLSGVLKNPTVVFALAAYRYREEEERP